MFLIWFGPTFVIWEGVNDKMFGFYQIESISRSMINVAEMKSVLYRIGNIVGKGENAG